MQKYKEGDIFTENNKTWTIKNGIKQTVSKFDSIRHLVNFPLVCPNCQLSMNHKLDKKFYILRHKCFDCVIKEETKLKIEGKYNEYEQTIINKNIKSWLYDFKSILDNTINSEDTINFSTEVGDNEKWVNNFDKEKLQEIIDKQFKELETELLAK